MRPATIQSRRPGGAFVRRFTRDRRGNIAVMGAVVLVPLTVLSGGAADYARAHRLQANLQNAIDAAVLTGAKAEMSPTKAREAFQLGSFPGVGIDPPVFTPVTIAGTSGLEGVATVQTPNAFLSMLGIASFSVRARAVAAVRRTTSDVCITTLDTGASAFSQGGTASIDASTCRFHVRSTASPAASFTGTGSVTALQFCVAGATISATGTGTQTVTRNCTLAQPYAGKPPTPSVSAGCQHTNMSVSGTSPTSLSPGVYCGATTLGGTGAFTLQPGLYVFRGVGSGSPGSLTVNGTGGVTGDGVTLYFADSSTMSLGGTGPITLKAPTSSTGGGQPGVLLSEAAGLSPTTMTINGTASLVLKGLVHLPSRNLNAGGTGGAATQEVTVVVNRFSLGGTGSWRMKPAPTSVADVGAPYLAS